MYNPNDRNDDTQELPVINIESERRTTRSVGVSVCVGFAIIIGVTLFAVFNSSGDEYMTVTRSYTTSTAMQTPSGLNSGSTTASPSPATATGSRTAPTNPVTVSPSPSSSVMVSPATCRGDGVPQHGVVMEPCIRKMGDRLVVYVDGQWDKTRPEGGAWLWVWLTDGQGGKGDPLSCKMSIGETDTQCSFEVKPGKPGMFHAASAITTNNGDTWPIERSDSNLTGIMSQPLHWRPVE